tara:strand:+ start:3192 stop:4826 length:1635 start_codon:yes stop_codon:yes gene_type:complete
MPSGSCDNKSAHPINTPFGDHDLTPLEYSWCPKSLNYTSHYLGKVTASGPSEAVPNYRPVTKPCKTNIHKKLNTSYCPINNTAVFASHNLASLKPVINVESVPYTSHYSGAYPKTAPSVGTVSYPPTTTPCKKNIPKQEGTCYCPLNYSSSTYSAHNISPLKPIVSVESISYSQHYLGQYPTYKKSEGQPNYRPYTGPCIKSDSTKPTAATYVSHVLYPPCVQQLETISGPYVSHSIQSLPNKYKGGVESNQIGPSAFSTKQCIDVSRPKSSCIVKLPENAPYTQHVLEMPYVIEPTYGLPFAQHSSQKYVRFDNSAGSAPALAVVNTMFDSKCWLPEEGYTNVPSSVPYGGHILIHKLKCKNNKALGGLYGSHGDYPYEPEVATFLTYCNPDIYSIPYGDHRWREQPATPFTQVKNSKNTETVVTKHINTTTGEIYYITPPETCPKAVLPFGDILNDGTKIGQRQCSPFASVNNKVGSGYPSYEVISGDPTGFHFTFQVSGLQKASTKYLGCNTRNTPFTQHTKYKETPFSVVSNNPHQINYL